MNAKEFQATFGKKDQPSKLVTDKPKEITKEYAQNSRSSRGEPVSKPESNPTAHNDTPKGQLSSFFLDHLERTGQIPEGSSLQQTSDYQAVISWKGYDYQVTLIIK